MKTKKVYVVMRWTDYPIDEMISVHSSRENAENAIECMSKAFRHHILEVEVE